MGISQLRQQFQTVGRWAILSLAAVALTVAYAGPSFSNSESTLAPHATATHEVQDVAWRGRRVYRRAYRTPYYRGYRGYGYGPRYNRGYYGRPYGGAVVTPRIGVYW